jgi:DNA-binding protein HU-beta
MFEVILIVHLDNTLRGCKFIKTFQDIFLRSFKVKELPMNKAELVDAIAKVTKQTKAETERTLDAFINVVSTNIKNREGVKLVGFGTFSVSDRKARVGRNPQTGQEIQIPARKVPVFRPGKELKELVR